MLVTKTRGKVGADELPCGVSAELCEEPRSPQRASVERNNPASSSRGRRATRRMRAYRRVHRRGGGDHREWVQGKLRRRSEAAFMPERRCIRRPKNSIDTESLSIEVRRGAERRSCIVPAPMTDFRACARRGGHPDRRVESIGAGDANSMRHHGAAHPASRDSCTLTCRKPGGAERFSRAMRAWRCGAPPAADSQIILQDERVRRTSW